MNFYKPIDYLYYKIGKTYAFLNLENSIYPSLATMISAIQWFSTLIIADFLFDILNQDETVKNIVVFGGFAIFIIINLLRYNDNSYDKFSRTWDFDASKNTLIYRIVLILYFAFTTFCLTQVIIL